MTAAARQAERLPDGFVRLVAVEPLRASPERAVAMLADDPPWVGLRREPSEVPELRRYALDLRLRVGGDAASVATFRKAAYVDFGQPRRTADGGWEVEIGWRASSAAPLFPVFSGRLTIGTDELRIEGVYAPPGGVVGRIADRVLLHVAARGTAEWLLAEIDREALAAR